MKRKKNPARWDQRKKKNGNRGPLPEKEKGEPLVQELQQRKTWATMVPGERLPWEAKRGGNWVPEKRTPKKKW